MPVCQITEEVVPTLQEHHIIPRERGGENGPTVFISPSLHDAIHRAAGNAERKARLLANYSLEVRNRIEMLLLAIEQANNLERVEKYQVTVTFSKEDFESLKKLSKQLNLSITKTVTALVKNLLTASREGL